MLTVTVPEKVKFICAFIYGKESVYQKIKIIMEKKFAEIDYESQPADFTFTDYYCAEMGKPLLRRFISFKNLKRTEEFAAIKLFCVKLERKFSKTGKRKMEHPTGKPVVPKIYPPSLRLRRVIRLRACPFSGIRRSNFYAFNHGQARGVLRRRINIDPGYLNLAKLVLLTTKDFSHRLHLGKGIYAEVTLQYKNKEYCDFPWTFPEYRRKESKDMFNAIRNIYKNNTNST